MRSIAMAFLFCLLSPIANAEPFELRKVIICDKAEIIFNTLASKFDEKPIWVGKTDRDTYITLTVNKEEHTWTLVEYQSVTACVLGVGQTSSDPEI